jgi:hypothetical protein
MLWACRIRQRRLVATVLPAESCLCTAPGVGQSAGGRIALQFRLCWGGVGGRGAFVRCCESSFRRRPGLRLDNF